MHFSQFKIQFFLINIVGVTSLINIVAFLRGACSVFLFTWADPAQWRRAWVEGCCSAVQWVGFEGSALLPKHMSNLGWEQGWAVRWRGWDAGIWVETELVLEGRGKGCCWYIPRVHRTKAALQPQRIDGTVSSEMGVGGMAQSASKQYLNSITVW